MDILTNGGYTPEIPEPENLLTKAEIEAQKVAEEEIREMKFLAKSPAWARAKKQFIEKIEQLKYDVVKSCNNNGSLENIGMNFKIYQICESELKSLIAEIEDVLGDETNEEV